MTTHYTAYAGDTLSIVVTVTDEAGVALDLTGASLVYVIDSVGGIEVLRKTSALGEITIASNVATIAIDAGDTDDLLGLLYHELECTDLLGNVSTLLAGAAYFTATTIVPVVP